MCGIAGVVSLRDGLEPASREQLERMTGALSHRGPDSFGAYRDARAALAHTRLSIIDLASGAQPLCNEDGTLWIVFNGEIFNYLELRQELIALGHRFKTQSDTEVIVHAFEEWGDGAFKAFNGQWAVALWDTKNGALTLARDRLGVRPLYFGEHGGRLYFASEVKALFGAEPSFPRALDPVGLVETFTFWSVVPPQSVFRGVFELEPGHVRTYARGRVEDRAIWGPNYPGPGERTGREELEPAIGRVREVLKNATGLRMLRADVPVGSYLSGGLDSSLVAALGREVKGEKFRTFSLRFEDAEFDETEYQRVMAKALNTEHHEVVVSARDIARVFPQVIYHTERPILRTAPAPLFLLSGAVRDAGIKVVLTGEGADEMFGGYDLFREGKVRRFWARQPNSKLRARLLERLYPYLARSPVSQRAMTEQFFRQNLDQHGSPGFAHDTRWRTTRALQRLFSAPVREEASKVDVVGRLMASLPQDLQGWDPLAQDQYFEVRTLLAGYLLSSQGDRMLMAHSVEGRFPFLDRDVVELANGLPASFKLKGLDEKHILKRAAAGLVAKQIIDRTKQPYRAPDGQCFVGEGAPDWVAEVLSERALTDAGLFETRSVQKLWRKCQAQAAAGVLSNSDNMALVGVLSTQLLHQSFVHTSPSIPLTKLNVFHDQLAPR
jgi:asparagine synthase (glutamine-hydrolysing)